MIEILNLRETKDGYLANGYIPLLPNDEQVLKWVKDKKEVMPMFTDAGIEAQILAEKVAEAKAYIAITDWVEPYILRHELGLFVLPNDSNKLVIKSMRDEKIEFIRKNDVSI